MWGRWMPALGITQSRESIRADMALMEADPDEGLSGIVRAYGNITTAARLTLFPAEWLAKAWTGVRSAGTSGARCGCERDAGGGFHYVGACDRNR